MRRLKRRRKKIIIIAGPNGAGKTTFAESFLSHEARGVEFINADLIAKEISPRRPEKAAIEAGRIMLTEIADRVARGESFAIETTLAGLNYARHIPQWRKLGYRVQLIFLSLASADVAVERVRARVAMGGHNIPESIIRRRFTGGLRNFRGIYRKIVDSWILYENDGEIPRILESGDNK